MCWVTEKIGLMIFRWVPNIYKKCVFLTFIHISDEFKLYTTAYQPSRYMGTQAITCCCVVENKVFMSLTGANMSTKYYDAAQQAFLLWAGIWNSVEEGEDNRRNKLLRVLLLFCRMLSNATLLDFGEFCCNMVLYNYYLENLYYNLYCTECTILGIIHDGTDEWHCVFADSTCRNLGRFGWLESRKKEPYVPVVYCGWIGFESI